MTAISGTRQATRDDHRQRPHRPTRTTRRRGVARADERRRRRDAKIAARRAPRALRAGKPVSAALSRLPFAVALILILAVGVGGVLYLGTKTDESGMRTESAKETSRQLRLTIEELGRSVAALSATPRIAAEARALGLVPAGDAAIITLDGEGAATVLGTPHVAVGTAGAEAGR